MAVYYKFKSARDYDCVPIPGQSISVVSLKDKIFHSKQLGNGRDFDLVVSNAETNEEYLDESAVIPRNSSVLIRRIAGWPCKPIVVEQDKPKIEDKVEDLTPPISSMMMGSPSTMGYTAEAVWDDFGDDPFAVPEVAVPAQLSNSVVDTSPACKADEDIKIKALVENSALDWSCQIAYGAGRGFGMRGRILGGRSFGPERQTPPAGYICHRCKVPGHFIQHCPTNGDPSYDIQRMKPSIDIQNSMPLASATSSRASSNGSVVILKPNEAASEKEIKGLTSTRPVSDIPPELRCPLCKELMKDSVLNRKCCFRSYCDKCIRDYIITNSKCMCGVMNVLADDLVPNIALREIITHTLKSTSCSTENLGSLTEVRDVDYVHNVQHKVPASKDAKQPLSKHTETLDASEGKVENVEAPSSIGANEAISVENFLVSEMDQKKLTGGEQGFVALDTSEGKVEIVEAHSTENKFTRKIGPSETIPLSVSAKEAEILPVPEMDQKKRIVGEQVFVEKKNKNKIPLLGTVADMSWRAYQNFGAENFYGIPTFNQYWTGEVPMGGDGYMVPFNGAMPYRSLTTGPFDAPSSLILPQEPFSVQGSMMPSFAQRKARVREVSSGGANDSPVKTKPSLTSQAAPVDRPDKEERSRHADKRVTDLRRHSSPRLTKHRESNSEKRKLDLNRHSMPRPVKQRTSRPEKSKLDSSRHSLLRPAKQKASSPEKRIPDWRRHSSPRPTKQRSSSRDRNQKHISLDENGNKKRKAMNGSKDFKVEPSPVGNGYWDERKTEKRSEGGVARRWWGGRSEEESSEEECHFKRRRRSPMRQPEDWNLPELDYGHGRAAAICG